MVTTTASLINSFLANSFSDIGARSPVIPQQAPFTLPNTITATEESDESALNDKREQDGKQQQALLQQNRQQSLKDLQKPQVALSPSDEAELFATGAADPDDAVPTITQSANLSDQVNSNRRLALVGSNREKASDVLQKRAQEAVANLYARNNNIVYNVTPLFSEAA